MPALKLTYFDFHGGRGEPARLALVIGDVPFEDVRVPLADWPSVRDEMPLKACPVLHVDGVAITQSNAINRYVGRLAGLYPEDPYQALWCDEVMDTIEDIGTRVVATMFMPDEERKAAREALVAGPIPLFVARMGEMLARGGGEHFADGRLTVADLKAMVWVKNLRSGILDHVPTDLPDRLAPALVSHLERVSAHPKIVAYYGGG